MTELEESKSVLATYLLLLQEVRNGGDPADIPGARQQASEALEKTVGLFLSTISERYVNAMRVCAGEDIIWGGDIELIEIAKILELQIVVHKNHIENVQPNFGDAKNQQTIHLLLAGENYGAGHYCLLVPDENNGFVTKGIDADGNCLFNACLTGKRLLDSPEEAFRQSDLNEIVRLRINVCDRLDNLLAKIKVGAFRDDAEDKFNYTEGDDPIKARFMAILEGEAENLSDHINDLPNSSLRQEAIELRESGLALTQPVEKKQPVKRKLDFLSTASPLSLSYSSLFPPDSEEVGDRPTKISRQNINQAASGNAPVPLQRNEPFDGEEYTYPSNLFGW